MRGGNSGYWYVASASSGEPLGWFDGGGKSVGLRRPPDGESLEIWRMDNSIAQCGTREMLVRQAAASGTKVAVLTPEMLELRPKPYLDTDRGELVMP